MHITKKIGFSVAAGVSLLALSLPFTLRANAQAGDPQIAQGQPPRQGGGAFGGQGQGGNFAPGQAGPQGGFGGQGRMMMPGGGGGGTAIDSDNMFLYVVQGNTIYKVSKGDLKLIGQVQLMPQGGPQPAIRGQDRFNGNPPSQAK